MMLEQSNEILDIPTNFLPFIIGGAVLFWFFFLRGKASDGSDLVQDLYLDDFEFKPNKRIMPDKLILELEGRRGGLWGWVLKKVGLNTQSYLKVTGRDVHFHFVTISSETTYVCPLDTVTCFLSGWQKPFRRLVIGGLLCVGGAIAIPIVGGIGFLSILFGVGFVISYLITKHLTLAFSTGELVNTYGLVFRMKTSGGKKLDAETLYRVVNYLNRILLHSKRQSEMEGLVETEQWGEHEIAIDPDELIAGIENEFMDVGIETEDTLPVDEALQLGKQKFKAGAFTDAIDLFTMVIKSTETHTEDHMNALRGRAKSYKETGQIAEYQAERIEYQRQRDDLRGQRGAAD